MREKLSVRFIDSLRPQQLPYEVRDTDLKGLFNKPQTYNENVRSFEAHKNSARQGLGDIASRRQLEDWEEEQRRLARNGDNLPRYGSSQNNVRGQAYALARATPVY